MSAQGIRAGRAYVEIGAVDQFTQVLNDAQTKLRGFATGIASVAATIAAPGLAMTLPLAAATTQFAAFDDAMRQAGAVSGATASELQAMSEQAEALGRTTSFTSAEVASLMSALGTGGFNPRQIKAMTAAVLNLARATGTDATRSAEIVTETINQFSLKAADGARVVDVLTLAANRTNVSVDSLGESLKESGAIAQQLGLSLEDTVAIIGTLGNAGIKGTEAGTALRRLGAISAATGEKLKEIFNVSNVDATGKLKPLVQVLDEIGQATANMGDAERVTKLEQAFGLMGITAASVISKTSQATQQLKADLLGAAGAAKTASDEIDAGIGGTIRRLQGAVEGVGMSVAKALEGPLGQIGEAFARALSDVAEWINKNQQVVIACAAVGAALMAMGAALLVVSSAVLSVVIHIAAMNLLIGVIAMLAKTSLGVFALAQMLRMWTTVTTLANFTFGLLTGTVKGSFGVVRMATSGIAALVARLLGASVASSTLTGATATLSAAQASAGMRVALFSASLTFLRGCMVALASPATLCARLGALVASSWRAVATAVRVAWASVLAPVGIFVVKAAIVIGLLYGLGKLFVTAAQRAGTFGGLMDTLSTSFSQLLGVVKSTFGGIATAIKLGNYSAAVTILWAGIKAAFWTGVEAVIGVIEYFVTNGLGEFLAFGKSLLTTLWDAFTAIPKMLYAALTGSKSLSEILAEALTGNLGQMLDGVKEFAKRSRQELAIQAGEQEKAARSAEVLADQRERLANLQELDKANETSHPSEEKKADDESKVATSDRAEYDANQAKIAALEAKLSQNGASPEQINRLKEDSVSGDDKKAESTQAINDRIAALKDETRTLKDGEAAAERYAFEQANVGETLLAAYDKAVQLNQEAKVAGEINERIKSLNEEAFALEHGTQVAERFKLAQMGATATQLKALEAAEKVAEAARKKDELNKEGASLKESLRNPLEVFRDELANFQELKAAGAIDKETFSRAKERARENLIGEADSPEKRAELMKAEQKRMQELIADNKIDPERAAGILTSLQALLNEAALRGKNAGEQMTKLTSSGTFSGFAVGRMAGGKGDSMQTRIAVAAEKTADEVKQTRKAIEKQAGGTYKE